MNIRNMKTAGGAVWTLRYGPMCGLIACIIALCSSAPPSSAQVTSDARTPPDQKAAESAVSQAEKLARAEDQRKAVLQAIEIHSRVQRIDGQGGTYPEDLVAEILRFYKYGTGTAGNPGDPVITQEFCREAVIALMLDLFLVVPPADFGQPRDDVGALQNPLDKESADLFKGALAEFLKYLKEAPLYCLASKVLTPGDPEGVDALKSLAGEEEFTKGERSLVKYALEEISHRRAPATHSFS